MRIQNSNNQIFYAKNPKIRFADDIVRKVNQCYPRISSSKMSVSPFANKYEHLIERYIIRTAFSLRFFKGELYDNATSIISKVRAFIEPILKYKIGNCGESAQLSAIVAKVNNIKDCHIACIIDSTGKNLDHSILFVNDKKPYIIDSWFGFADYVPNAITKYENEYRRFFDIKDGEKIAIAADIDDEYTDCLKTNFSRGQINKILKMYPEMRIPIRH